MTRVVISQPMYFPWVGFMEQMLLADVFIWLDEVQYVKKSFTNRVQVKQKMGVSWITIPLVGGGNRQPISSLRASGDHWMFKHRKTILNSFNGYTHADRAISVFDAMWANNNSLCDQLIAGTELQAREIGCLPKTVLKSSEMGIFARSSERLLKLTQAVGGTDYVTGHGAAQYLNHSIFDDAKIDVSYMQYNPRPWPQNHGEFTPFVTGLDLLASTGRSAASHLRPTTRSWKHFIVK